MPTASPATAQADPRVEIVQSYVTLRDRLPAVLEELEGRRASIEATTFVQPAAKDLLAAGPDDAPDSAITERLSTSLKSWRTQDDRLGEQVKLFEDLQERVKQRIEELKQTDRTKLVAALKQSLQSLMAAHGVEEGRGRTLEALISSRINELRDLGVAVPKKEGQVHRMSPENEA